MADVIPMRRPAPLEIPLYVRNLNAIAERAGMTVDIYVGPYSNNPELRLWSHWRGTKAQLRATGLLTAWQDDQLNLTRDRHYTLNIGTVSLRWWRVQILSGKLTTSGDRIGYEIDSGPAVYRIEQRGGAEIVHADELTTYRGSLEALLALGIERDRLPTGKHGGRHDNGWSSNGVPWYASRRQPDGSVVYRVQTESAIKRAKQEYDDYVRRQRVTYLTPDERAALDAPKAKPRPALRLVVDNTREVRP